MQVLPRYRAQCCFYIHLGLAWVENIPGMPSYTRRAIGIRWYDHEHDNGVLGPLY